MPLCFFIRFADCIPCRKARPTTIGGLDTPLNNIRWWSSTPGDLENSFIVIIPRFTILNGILVTLSSMARNDSYSTVYKTKSLKKQLHNKSFYEQAMKEVSCLNFWDEACWFLSLRFCGLLSSSLLLFTQRFGRYVLRPSSGVCRTREPSRNFELRPLLKPRGSPVLIPLAITGYKC